MSLQQMVLKCVDFIDFSPITRKQVHRRKITETFSISSLGPSTVLEAMLNRDLLNRAKVTSCWDIEPSGGLAHEKALGGQRSELT